MASTEPLQGEAGQASKELQPLRRQSEASLAEETSVSRYDLKAPQETPSVTESQSGRGLSQEAAGGHLGLLSPEPRQDTQVPRLGPTLLLGLEAIFTTPREPLTGTRDRLEASEPESSKGHEVDTTAPSTALVGGPLASSSEEPAASFVEGSVGAPGLESTPKWPVSWHGRGLLTHPALRLCTPEPSASCRDHVAPRA